MAAYLWCLGIAMIYPPGAMNIGLRPYMSTTDMEVLVMNRAPPTDFDPQTWIRDEPFPTLASLTWGGQENATADDNQIHFYYGGARPALHNIAQSLLMGDRMLNFPSYTGVHSTYRLDFRAPQFRCPGFASIWDDDQSKLSFKKHVVNNAHLTSAAGNSTGTGVFDVQELICQGQSVFFDLNITHTEGVQSITHGISDVKELQRINKTFTEVFISPTEPRGTASMVAEQLRAFTFLVASHVPLMNEMALLDSLGSRMLMETSQSCSATGSNFTLTTYDDGTVEPNWQCEVAYNNSGPSLRGTALHTNRFDNKFVARWHPPGDVLKNSGLYPGLFDPLKDINPTEDLLNTLLFNITVSALSLGTWKANVPVTTTRYRNTYLFSHRRNLVLPYSICFAIALVFAVIAMWSLHQNGVPAADGGFLQVMMATRGDTEMERLVLREGLVPVDEVSKDLGNLKVQYGELRGQENRMGFGTVDETVALKKRNQRKPRIQKSSPSV